MKKHFIYILLSIFIVNSLRNIQSKNKIEIISNLKNYSIKELNGGTQNWDLDIDKNNKLYIGNNKGLIIYDGNNSSIYPINNKAIKTVKVIGEKIYTGGDSNLGYWEKTPDGHFEYTSLLQLVPQERQQDTFLSFATDQDIVYIQSYACILKYDGKKIKEINNDFNLNMHQKGKSIFMHKYYKGIYTLRKDSFVQIINNDLLEKDELEFIDSIDNNKLIWGTNHGKIFVTDRNNITIRLDTEKILHPYNVECGTVIDNKYLAIGTSGGGVFIFDINGKFIYNLDEKDNLGNNYIHRMIYKDYQLWIATDNGISKLSTHSPIMLWKKDNKIGRLTSSAIKDEKIYIGTNYGLFVNDTSFNYNFKTFNQITGEVFSLEHIKNEILCGTHEGCYRITEKNELEKISTIGGINGFKYISENGVEYLVGSSYSHLVYFKHIDNQWKEISHVKNILNRFDDYLPESPYLIWGIHSQKGIFKIKINKELNHATSINVYKDIDGIKDYSNIYIHKIDGRIYFFTSDGVYYYDSSYDKFVKNPKLSDAIHNLRGMNYISKAFDNFFWISKDNELYYYHLTESSAEEVGRLAYLDYNFNQLDRNIKIVHLFNNYFLTSTADGLIILNSDLFDITRLKNNDSIMLENISYVNEGVKYANIQKGKTDVAQIPFYSSDVTIKTHKGINASSSILRYKISNDRNSKWSNWSQNGEIVFPKLPIGTHLVEIQDFYGKSKRIELRIIPPIYLSPIAIVSYILILLFIVFYITRMIQHRKRNKLIERHKLEQKLKDDEIIALKNEELKRQIKYQQDEINEKLRSLVQKQELLYNIDKEFENQKRELGERYPKRMYEKIKKIINSGMTTEKDFMLFQNYYQEINHEFMLKLKEMYPDLSPSELKFCCLMRSNLSTKDIASILNITSRGVELKRYRIKKKIDIEQSLQDFILSI